MFIIVIMFFWSFLRWFLKKMCIACITIDSVMNFDKKNHPQVYLEQCKYRPKKIQMSRFINTELKSDSESSDSDLDLDDNEFKRVF